ncbi:MAG: 4Fe-4S cluster-binding domain-containing protein [Anaerolineales bacterium]|nr:4Fe-4S cluster-binding domain-containing protein [Anaerolineales bacterium]
MSEFRPAYLGLLASGELRQRAETAYAHLRQCDVCAWECGVDRASGKLGICHTGLRARVASFGAHHGEEAPLSGWRGSGTIFFGRCNLHCQYCQNHEISQVDAGEELEPEALAEIMLTLQAGGCHNINLVSPSHVVPQILAATLTAAEAGLRLPLVYNSGGYDALETLRWLDGVIDIYMPDMKYASAQIGLHYSKIRNYPEVNQTAVREMHRQVGDLQLDAEGIAQRGLLVRHLVLPNKLAGTAEIVRFIAEEISTDTYLNIMDQYRPTFHASQFPKVNRRVTREEMQEAVQHARQAGLHRLDSGD